MHKAMVQSLPDYTYTQLLTSDGHSTVADEPTDAGGNGLGPSPYEFLLWALGACTSMTLQMYAERKGYPLEEVAIQMEHDRVHAEDTGKDGDASIGRLDVIRRKIVIRGDLTDEQRADLLRVAKKCPVARTIESGPVIEDEIEVVA